MEYGVKRLKTGDIPAYRSMLDVFARAFEDPKNYTDKQPDAAYTNALLAQESFVALVAVVGDEVVGALAGYELPKFEQARSEFYIYDLAVDETHRRKGIATALINRFRNIAKDHNGWVVFVQADYEDPPAIALYERLGTREEVLHFDIEVD